MERNSLLAKANVVGVGTGYREVGGVRTEEVCTVVLVREKLPPDKLAPEDLIPDQIEGVKTDVRAVGHIRATAPDTAKYRPVRGGISVFPGRDISSFATLGAVVADLTTGQPMALGCHHSFAFDHTFGPADSICQPAIFDGGLSADTIGTVTRTSFTGGESSAAGTAGVDAAVGFLDTSTISWLNIVQDLGYLEGTITPQLGSNVFKRGRTSQITYGTVTAIDLSIAINYTHPSIPDTTMHHQIEVTARSPSTTFQESGDSGSVLILENGTKVMGLLYAANVPTFTIGYAQPIAQVFSNLGVTLLTDPRMAQSYPRLTEFLRLPAPKSQFEEQLVRVIAENHRAVAQLTNGLAEGKRAALYTETTAMPTAGAYAVGDFVPRKNAVEQGSAGVKYIHYGWQCVQEGSASASSFVALRALTGN